MSNYARLIRPVSAFDWQGEVVVVSPGTQIRGVSKTNYATAKTSHFSPGWRFQALLDEWKVFTTSADLPSFTDRGSARAEDPELPVHPALMRGRPPGDRTNVLGVRVTKKQHEWITLRAEKSKLSCGEYVRSLLVREGMPT